LNLPILGPIFREGRHIEPSPSAVQLLLQERWHSSGHLIPQLEHIVPSSCKPLTIVNKSLAW